MKKTNVVIAALFISFSSLSCIAQQQEKKDPMKVHYLSHASYSSCEKGADVDKYVKEVEAPLYNKLVEQGVIDSWGSSSNYVGGPWQKLLYIHTDTLDELFDGIDTVRKALSVVDESPCTVTDEYFWEGKYETALNSDGKSNASMSIYFVCDQTREGRADEIFRTLFAPIYEETVEKGMITNWGWGTHLVGAEYRRLQTMSGESFKSVIAAREHIHQVVYGGDDQEKIDLHNEFNEICGSHTDYFWSPQQSSE